MASLTGRIEVRFADSAVVTQAIDGSPCELEFAYSLGANASFTLTAHAVYLPVPRVENCQTADQFRMGGCQAHRPRPHVHRRPRQQRRD